MVMYPANDTSHKTISDQIASSLRLLVLKIGSSHAERLCVY